jgi:hypothetical protein
MRLIESNTYATPVVEKLLISLRFFVTTEKWIIALVSTKLVTPPLVHGSKSSFNGMDHPPLQDDLRMGQNGCIIK